MPKRSASSPRDGRDEPKGPSDDPLRALRRVGRPTLGVRARQLIAIRLDPDVLKELRREAARRNLGYQTLVNRVLADYVRRHVA